MTGRNTFDKYSPIIYFISRVLSLLGLRFNRFFLGFFSGTQGNLGFLIRYVLLKNLTKELGANVLIGQNVNFVHHANLSIGDNVSIHENCHISCSGHVNIGTNVSIAHNSTLIASTHTFEDPNVPIKYGKIKSQPINISNDVWIGAGVRILGDVTIANRVIVAANAVVNKNIDHPGIYGGVPAKFIKSLETS